MPESGKNWIKIGAVAFVLLAIGAGYLLWQSFHYESTDDAFIESHVFPVSSRVKGQVTQVLVQDNQSVKENDLLVMIDPATFEAKLDVEKAKLAAAQAEAKRASSDVARYAEILKKDEISAQQYDHAQSAAASARAAVDREKAEVDQAALQLSYTRITAPSDGLVTRKAVEPGAFVQDGQPLLAVVSSDVWVTANFKETQLEHIRVGQPVDITVDAFPDKIIKGTVQSVQAGTGARFSLFPPENATGNFVKVVQRVPVKISLGDAGNARPFLAPGMSVLATIKVR